MNDEMEKRVISILATGIAYMLANQLAHRLIQEPEVRGVRDDFKEGLLSGASSLLFTVVASVVIRRVVGGR